MEIIYRKYSRLSEVISYGTGPPGYIDWAYVAWRAGTKSANLAQTCLKLRLLVRIFLKLRYRAGIFKKSMGATNRGGIGLSYRPARLHRLTEFIPWNPFRGPYKHLKIRAQYTMHLRVLTVNPPPSPHPFGSKRKISVTYDKVLVPIRHGLAP
jgi:hypothetical protein